MKKALLVTLWSLSILSSYIVGAQTFTTGADTVYFTVGGNNATIHNDITNTQTRPMNIRTSYVGDNFPSDWKNGLGVCDATYCYNDYTTSHTTPDSPYLQNVAKTFDIQLANMASATPGTYYITFAVKDMTNAGGYSKPLTFMVSKFPTAVTKVNKPEDDITLYPNPARSELNVLFNPDAGIKLITVYNLIGKAVTVYKLSSNSSAKLDVENLPSGVYFIRLIDGAGQVVATRKFTHQ